MREKKSFYKKIFIPFLNFILSLALMTIVVAFITLSEFKLSNIAVILICLLIIFFANRITSHSSIVDKISEVTFHINKKFISNTERSILLIANDIKSLNQAVAKNESFPIIISHLDEFKKDSNTFNKITNNIVLVHDKFLSTDWKENKYLIEKKVDLLKLLNPK